MWKVSRRPAFFVILLLASIAAAGCGGSSGPSGPPPQLLVAQVADLGAIPTNPDILGRDGAYSALFQGASVWVYGDTFIARADAHNRTLLSDSWSFTTVLNAQSGITGFQERLDSTSAPTMILPETPAEQAFNQAHNVNNCQASPCGARWALWPGAIVVNPADNTALIFYTVVSAQPGAFNFQGIGASVATWQGLQSTPQRPNLNPPIVADHPDLMFTENEPGFGSTAFVSGGTLYVYGCGVGTDGADKGCRLGKVAPSSAQDRSAWTFYAGNGNWSSQVGDAVSLFSGDNILSVSWNNFLQSYVAIYSQVFSQNVMIRTSPKPEGPWSGETVAFVAMQPSSGNVFDAHAHSEYDVSGGQTIFVTYSRTTPAPFSSEVRLVSVKLQRTSSPAP
jgi:hypothetical protein